MIIILMTLLPLTIKASEIEINTEKPLENSLLWKLSGNQLTQPSYIYGTMHLTCDDQTVKKHKIQKAINNTVQLYLEVDFDDSVQMTEFMQLIANEIKIKDIGDVDKREELIKLASHHLQINRTIVAETSTFMLFSLLSMKAVTTCSLPSSVEQLLMPSFKKEDKKIEGLETFAQQMQFFKDSGVIDIDVIIQSLKLFDQTKTLFNDMSKYYTDENINGIYTKLTMPSELYTVEYTEKLREILLDKRNKNWVELIPSIAKDAPTLFAVGAGHLPGNNGIIQLLRIQGYTVEPVFDVNPAIANISSK